jgi:hypothetical protein
MTTAYRLSNHAVEEMARRGISEELVAAVMADPEQIVPGYGERVVYQSRHTINDTLYIIRVIVEKTDPLTVVTVYRSSKVTKYWRDDDEGNL